MNSSRGRSARAMMKLSSWWERERLLLLQNPVEKSGNMWNHNETTG
jgi:hypothetical protein